MQVAETKQITDEYISFEKTNYRNPYNDPLLLEMEDVFGYMLTYKRPFTQGDIGYLIRKKKGLHAKKCTRCYRLPENRRMQPFAMRDIKTTKRLNIDKSRESGTAIHYMEAVSKPKGCEDCRVLKLKRSINREVETARFPMIPTVQLTRV